MVTYDAATPKEYLQQLKQDWRRERLMELRDAIRRAAPDWEETISYRMMGFGPPQDPVLHLNAQKHFVGLYVGDIDKVDPEGALAGGIDRGKGCLRFKRHDAVTDEIERFLERFVAMKRSGADRDC